MHNLIFVNEFLVGFDDLPDKNFRIRRGVFFTASERVIILHENVDLLWHSQVQKKIKFIIIPTLL
jgi:hypothetical protein